MGNGHYKNITVTDTNMTPDLIIGFVISHLDAVKHFPVNPRVITGSTKMSLLLEARSTPSLIIKLRLILGLPLLVHNILPAGTDARSKPQ